MKINPIGNLVKTKPIQSQSKPIQSQYKPNSRKAKMNVTSILTKDYKNKPRLRTPPKQTQSNPISKGIPYCSAERIDRTFEK